MWRLNRLLPVLLVFLLATVCEATVLKHFDLQALTSHSNLIVSGLVVERQTIKDPQTGRLVTFTQLDVETRLKGESPKRITIKQIGGELNGVAMWIPGSPRFDIGSRVVAFLKDQGAPGKRTYTLRGMGQGLFKIALRDGVPTAFQQTGSVSVVSVDAAGTAKAPVAAQPRVLPLAELIQRVTTLLAASPASPSPTEVR